MKKLILSLLITSNLSCGLPQDAATLQVPTQEEIATASTETGLSSANHRQAPEQEESAWNFSKLRSSITNAAGNFWQSLNRKALNPAQQAQPQNTPYSSLEPELEKRASDNEGAFLDTNKPAETIAWPWAMDTKDFVAQDAESQASDEVAQEIFLQDFEIEIQAGTYERLHDKIFFNHLEEQWNILHLMAATIANRYKFRLAILKLMSFSDFDFNHLSAEDIDKQTPAQIARKHDYLGIEQDLNIIVCLYAFWRLNIFPSQLEKLSPKNKEIVILLRAYYKENDFKLMNFLSQQNGPFTFECSSPNFQPSYTVESPRFLCRFILEHIALPKKLFMTKELKKLWHTPLNNPPYEFGMFQSWKHDPLWHSLTLWQLERQAQSKKYSSDSDLPWQIE